MQSETEFPDSPPITLCIAGGAILPLLIAYPIGYLLIDVLRWITLTPEQMQGGCTFTSHAT